MHAKKRASHWNSKGYLINTLGWLGVILRYQRVARHKKKSIVSVGSPIDEFQLCTEKRTTAETQLTRFRKYTQTFLLRKPKLQHYTPEKSDPF